MIEVYTDLIFVGSNSERGTGSRGVNSRERGVEKNGKERGKVITIDQNQVVTINKTIISEN